MKDLFFRINKLMLYWVLIGSTVLLIQLVFFQAFFEKHIFGTLLHKLFILVEVGWLPVLILLFIIEAFMCPEAYGSFTVDVRVINKDK